MSYIWFVFKQRAEFKRIYIEGKDNLASIREKIAKEFKLDNRLSFRLRNNRGNLVPINSNLPKNSKKSPYKIEVYLPLIRDTVSTNKIKNLDRLTTALATKSVLTGFYQKLFRLETTFKYSQNQLQKVLEQTLNDIESRLNFVENRFSHIEKFEWKGDFRRPILW